jgi:NAD(P)H-dependent FMN reductase
VCGGSNDQARDHHREHASGSQGGRRRPLGPRHREAAQRCRVEIVDIQDFDLPLLDEPVPPSLGQYSQEHTKTWAAKIASFDAYIFVTPEYNHGIPGALKNAIDYLYREWNNKAAGFVSYGAAGGTRAVEHLRLIMAELQVATVRAQVPLSLFTDFESFSVCKPEPRRSAELQTMLDQLIAWGTALRTVRSGTSVGAA